MPLLDLFKRRTDSTRDGDRLAQQLSQLPGFRVLRELTTEGLVDDLGPRQADDRIIVIVDTETTGLDPTTDCLVEIAVERIRVDAGGEILAMERPRAWREDPGRPMPERLTALTGLTDADLLGCVFDDECITALLGSADIIVAHNAAFDRPFVDLRFPALEDSAWACSLAQLDWLALGFDGRALGHLLLQAGWYFQGHRAEQDVHALATLLGGRSRDGRTILSHLLARCDLPSFHVAAVGAPFDAKDLLKARGYRWDAAQRYWWRDIVDEPLLDAEKAWLSNSVYGAARGQPSISRITARERFTRKI